MLKNLLIVLLASQFVENQRNEELNRLTEDSDVFSKSRYQKFTTAQQGL